MKSLLCLMVCSVLALPGYTQDEKELIQKLRAKLEKVNDYKASGRLKIDVPFVNAPESDVNVFYRKPDKFRIKKSGGISIMPKGGVSINLNTLLSAGGRFEAIGAGTRDFKGIRTKMIKLVPLDENSDIILTTLYIDEKNLLIRKTAVTTRENGSYEMEMDYGRYSSYGLPDKVVFLFNTKDYKLPKGIAVEYDKGPNNGQKPKSNKGSVEIKYSSYTINKGVEDKEFL